MRWPTRDGRGAIAKKSRIYAGLRLEPRSRQTGTTARGDGLDGRLDQPRSKTLGVAEIPALKSMRATLVDLKCGLHRGVNSRCGVHDDVPFSRSCPSHNSLSHPFPNCSAVHRR
jgi:hypothetical protein